jgi:hypothetical protein
MVVLTKNISLSRKKKRVWFLAFSALVLFGTADVSAQHDCSPSQQLLARPHVVSIRDATSSGMCYGYCSAEIRIKGRSVWFFKRVNENRDRYPERKIKRTISQEEWEGLLKLVDKDALLAVPDRIGCPGCADEIIEWTKVGFSDGTKKSVTYNFGQAPQPIALLSQRIESIRRGMEEELIRKYPELKANEMSQQSR